jgi:DNA-binding NarL/FixJ family response regulator
MHMTVMNNQRSTEKAALIYDDHELFSSSFSVLLQKSGHFSEIYTFKTESELTQFVLQNPLNNPYIFCDYFVPGSNTIHLIFNVHKFCPSAKIIMVSSITNGWLIRKILSYKIDGFISKSDGIDQITACLSAVANKEVFVSASVDN